MYVMYVVCVLCSPLNLMDEVAHQLVNSSSSLEPAQPKNDVSVVVCEHAARALLGTFLPRLSLTLARDSA